MSTMKKKNYLVDSVEGDNIKQELQQMAADQAFNTMSSYSANTKLYANNSITFVEKHMAYLNNNPTVDPNLYLSNLRLMTRVRR